jgi:hypothetical protein
MVLSPQNLRDVHSDLHISFNSSFDHRSLAVFDKLARYSNFDDIVIQH